MKVLDLQCAHGHVFEGWFASEDAFQEQLASGLLECPVCANRDIHKRLSAPRLNLSGAQAPEAAPDARAPKDHHAPVAEADAQRASRQAAWLGLVREVMRQTEDVGERFVQEARRMHQGETPARGIRGQASAEQVAELLEEGVPVLPLPVPAGLKETLQ